MEKDKKRRRGLLFFLILSFFLGMHNPHIPHHLLATVLIFIVLTEQPYFLLEMDFSNTILKRNWYMALILSVAVIALLQVPIVQIWWPSPYLESGVIVFLIYLIFYSLLHISLMNHGRITLSMLFLAAFFSLLKFDMIAEKTLVFSFFLLILFLYETIRKHII